MAAVRNQICTDPVAVVDGKFCVRFDPGHALGDDARVFCRIAVFLQQNMQFVAKLFVMVFGLDQNLTQLLSFDIFQNLSDGIDCHLRSGVALAQQINGILVNHSCLLLGTWSEATASLFDNMSFLFWNSP